MKDFHVHSGFLDHTRDDLDSIIEAADRLGFAEIAVTEHFIWTAAAWPKKDEETLFIERSDIPDDGRRTTDLSTYLAEIDRLSRHYRMRIIKGLEVDYFPEFEVEIRELLARFHFELVLGSCHYVRDETPLGENRYIHVGSPEGTKTFFDKYGPEQVCQTYFDNVALAVRSDLFDYMAHLDFIKKACPDYSTAKNIARIVPILRLMIERNVGLEINMKGLKRFGEPYPSYEVIEEYRRLGGRKLSVGSDAHSIRQLITAKHLIQQHEQRYLS